MRTLFDQGVVMMHDGAVRRGEYFPKICEYFLNKNIHPWTEVPVQWPLISVAVVAVAAKVSVILESIFRLSILEF